MPWLNSPLDSLLPVNAGIACLSSWLTLMAWLLLNVPYPVNPLFLAGDLLAIRNINLSSNNFDRITHKPTNNTSYCLLNKL